MNIFVPQVFPFHMFPDINSSHNYLTFVCPYIEVINIMIFFFFFDWKTVKNVSANASETLAVLHRPVTIAAGRVVVFPGEVRVGLG